MTLVCLVILAGTGVVSHVLSSYYAGYGSIQVLSVCVCRRCISQVISYVNQSTNKFLLILCQLKTNILQMTNHRLDTRAIFSFPASKC